MIKNEQLFYKFIYNLELVKLKMLKTYIKTNIANNFLNSSKSLVKAYIFFIKKLDQNV